MLIVIGIISLLYIIMLILILRAYYRDNEEIDKRLLYLEKRVNENGIFISNNGSEIIKLKRLLEEGDDNMPCSKGKKGKGGGRKK